ncbi:hypothetical protein [Sulfolobus tengchongensis spindle-shaped virus 3]|nr:hypothetical protein [Sulfolobus tengchongensis spindle-shaped virus 3]
MGRPSLLPLGLLLHNSSLLLKMPLLPFSFTLPPHYVFCNLPIYKSFYNSDENQLLNQKPS